MKRTISVFLVLFAFLFVFSTISTIPTDAAPKTPKAYLSFKGKKASLGKKTRTLYVGGKDIRLSYHINGKTKGVKGRWVSSDSDIVKVDKNGKVKAYDNGNATVKYIFRYGRKTYSVSTKFRVKTKAAEVNLSDYSGNGRLISTSVNKKLLIKTAIVPVDEALDVNEEIESTYKAFYTLYADRACTLPTDLASVDEDGNITTGEFGGTVFLRAKGAESLTSKNFIPSNVLEIRIDGLTKEEKALEEERKRKEAEEKAKLALLKPARIEIVKQAPVDSSTPNPIPENALVKINAEYRIFDGNGKDITFTTGAAISALSGTFRWNNQDFGVAFTQSGKASINIFNIKNVQTINNQIITTPVQILFSRGLLTLTYKEAGYPDVSGSGEVTIMPQAAVARMEVKGIYKRDLQTQNYISVLEGNNIRIKKGDVIASSGGNVMINQVPGSYFLLLKATDIYNNNVAASGISAASIGLAVTGTAGIKLDNVTGIGSSQAIPQSVNPIVIDGMPYLSFPLMPATVAEGSLEVMARGMQPFTREISDGATMVNFFITGVVKGTGRAIATKENILEYQLITSTGQTVTKYERVLSFLKIDNPGNAAIVNLLPTSEVISSAKNSIFRIRKNSAGDAEIIYIPQMNALTFNPPLPNVPYNPNAIYMPGTDEVTLLRGWGQLERKIPVIVYRE